MAKTPLEEWNEKLINLMRLQPNLYDLGDPNYYQRDYKEACWDAIAKELDSTGKNRIVLLQIDVFIMTMVRVNKILICRDRDNVVTVVNGRAV
jgi:hypothetical protein